jgi:hypothetical protein
MSSASVSLMSWVVFSPLVPAAPVADRPRRVDLEYFADNLDGAGE